MRMQRWVPLVTAFSMAAVVACTSPDEPTAPAKWSGGSSSATWTFPRRPGAQSSFVRATSDGIASTNSTSARERKAIGDTDDFVTMSPDGCSFVDAVADADGNVVPATFDIDASGYADGTPPTVSERAVHRPDRRRGPGAPDHSGNPPADFAVGYSPDGSRAMFIRQVKPYDHSGPMDVFVVRTDGSGLTH